jgi:hypothetical protein
MEEMKSRLILLYILMLIAHQAQIFEELWEHSILVTSIGENVYVLMNWVLFCLPLALLYFIFIDKKWAYYLSAVYSIIMMFQGVERVVMSFVQGTLTATFPIVLTGAIIYLIGIPMVYYIYKNIKRISNQSTHLERYKNYIKT